MTPGELETLFYEECIKDKKDMYSSKYIEIYLDKICKHDVISEDSVNLLKEEFLWVANEVMKEEDS